MGRTIPSFRIAAEIERTKWKQFRSLLAKKDRKMFDEMFDYVKLHNTTCMLCSRPDSTLEIIPYLEDRIQRMKGLINGIIQKEPALANP